MKKKLVLALATLMCISLCACGGSENTSGDNKEEGFTPSQPTQNTEVVEETEEKVVFEEIDTENLQKYYDTEKFVGTPKLDKAQILRNASNGECMITRFTEGGSSALYHIVSDVEFPRGDHNYYVIFTDNNTPDDYSDDIIAYIFTTPID